jgi:hypothetical protein
MAREEHRLGINCHFYSKNVIENLFAKIFMNSSAYKIYRIRVLSVLYMIYALEHFQNNLMGIMKMLLPK